MTHGSVATANLVVEPFAAGPTPEAAVVIFAQFTPAAILESSAGTGPYGRFSIFADHPTATLDIPPDHCPFNTLGEATAPFPTIIKETPLPFPAGWIGYLGYESGLVLEQIPRAATDDLPLPPGRFHLYDSAAIYDHRRRRWYLAAIDWPAPFRRQCPPVEHRLRRLRQRLARATDLDLSDPPPPSAPRPATPNMTHSEYLAKVARARQYIDAGDIYQVNLTQRFAVADADPPLDVYRRLRRISPSTHAAFLRYDDFTVISSSPELFLDLRDDGRVTTRPIKGTRPRGTDARADRANRITLRESEKDRAELNMIIDLLRNDLGRVCRFGSVRVREAGRIETHPTVFHRVATIEGRLRPECSWIDLLRATFPGGSITGTPKIRAMQIISEMEPTTRGVYCGSIGWIGLDGTMRFNIAIRTMIHDGHTARAWAGGAIVADSDPEAEYQETLAKAAGMLRALGATIPDDPIDCDPPGRQMKLAPNADPRPLPVQMR